MEAIEGAKAAARFAPELDADGIASLAGVAVDISKRFKVSPEEAIGFTQGVASQARVTKLPALVQNVAPAVGNLTQMGFSPQQAGSKVATITQGTGDSSGATGATAGLAFGRALEERFDESPDAAMSMLAKDPALKKRFFEGGEFEVGGEVKKFGKPALGEGKAIPTIRALLTEGSDIRTQYTQGQKQVGTLAQGGETYKNTIAQIESLPEVQNAIFNRLLESSEEEIAIKSLKGGRAAIGRQGLEKIMKASGVSSVGQYVRQISFEATTGGGQVAPLDNVSDQLESIARRKSQPQAASSGIGDGGIVIQPSQEDRQIAAALMKAADKLEALEERFSAAEERMNRQEANPQGVMDVRIIEGGGGREFRGPKRGGQPVESLTE